jgi:hypothetical protein
MSIFWSRWFRRNAGRHTTTLPPVSAAASSRAVGRAVGVAPADDGATVEILAPYRPYHEDFKARNRNRLHTRWPRTQQVGRR